RIHAPRDRVSFEPGDARVDVIDLRRRCADGLAHATVDELAALARQFRGELLEGLELDDFHEFRAWCVAEREDARRMHGAILRALRGRLEDDPEAALPHARTLAVVEPLDESARAGLIRTLAASGRTQEAEEHYEAARRLLTELGRPPS